MSIFQPKFTESGTGRVIRIVQPVVSECGDISPIHAWLTAEPTQEINIEPIEFVFADRMTDETVKLLNLIPDNQNNINASIFVHDQSLGLSGLFSEQELLCWSAEGDQVANYALHFLLRMKLRSTDNTDLSAFYYNQAILFLIASASPPEGKSPCEGKDCDLSAQSMWLFETGFPAANWMLYLELSSGAESLTPVLLQQLSSSDVYLRRAIEGGYGPAINAYLRANELKPTFSMILD